MATISVEKLLRDKRVIAEIERHLWIESEKAGYDIGFERAKEEWLKNFSSAWMNYHMPETFIESRKQAKRAEVAQRASSSLASGRRSRARAYAAL